MSKYHAIKTIIDGISFASKAEATRYSVLRMLEKNGDIKSLELQPKYPVVIEGKKICTYIADFRYFDNWTKATITEDVKGMRTPVYRIKKKLVEALYKIVIVET